MLTNKASVVDVDRHLFREGYPVAIVHPSMDVDEAVEIVEQVGLSYMWLENAAGDDLMVLIAPSGDGVDESLKDLCDEMCGHHGYVIVDSAGETTAFDALGEAILTTEDTKSLYDIVKYFTEAFGNTDDAFVLEDVTLPDTDRAQRIVRSLNEELEQMELNEKHQLTPMQRSTIISHLGSGKKSTEEVQKLLASMGIEIGKSTLARWEHEWRMKQAGRNADFRKRAPVGNIDTFEKMLKQRGMKLRRRKTAA